MTELQLAPENLQEQDDKMFGDVIVNLRPALQGYIRSLLIDNAATDDVLQETCLFLWERRQQYVVEEIRPSAFRIAWFKVLAHRRSNQRNRVIHLSDEALQRISDASLEIADQTDPRLHALLSCMAKLPPPQLKLLGLKYLHQTSLAKHSRQHQLPPNRLQKSISRLRLALRHCIESKLSNR